jgi:type 1 glutamine amidotransferase
MIYSYSIIFYIFISLLFPVQEIECLNCSDENTFSVLILTETKGYVHRSAIKAGKELINNIGNENNFNVFHSNNSSVITSENLIDISALIFLNTTSDILNADEQKVMEDFIKGGKGFVGIHSAADTEYKWNWYGRLVGGYFKNHPPGTSYATIETIKNNHISTKHLDNKWEIKDEWYNYYNLNPDINVLLNLDESTYYGGTHGENHPITWYHQFDGGRSFYTGLGHLAKTYSDQRFIKLLTGGILYASFPE